MSFLSKSLYIYNTILIVMVNSLGKNDVKALYKDAIYSHLLREGVSEYIAENEARRRMRRDDELL
jgi:hypothetical protein